ncbi:MAG: hypothetical protein WC004_02675 [Candidatus Absconditabacterales bacterium]
MIQNTETSEKPEKSYETFLENHFFNYLDILSTCLDQSSVSPMQELKVKLTDNLRPLGLKKLGFNIPQMLQVNESFQQKYGVDLKTDMYLVIVSNAIADVWKDQSC